MKWSVVLLLLLGLLAAMCVAVMVSLMPGRGGAVAGGVPGGGAGEATVLVAARDMPAMTVLDERCLTTTTVPKGKVAANSLASAVEVTGQVLAMPMVAGQPFTRACFAADGARSKLASTLARGKRAVAITVTDHGGLDGILYPGSVVDVLASFKEVEMPGQEHRDAISTTLISAAEVLAVEKITVVQSDTEKKLDAEPSDAATRGFQQGHRVTLLVDLKQAKALQLATDQGTITLALRNPLEPIGREGDAVALSSILGRQGAAVRGAWMTTLATMMTSLQSAAVNHAAEAAMPRTAPPMAVAPTTQPLPRPQWDVTIIHGSAVEVRQFEMPVEPPAVAVKKF